MDECMLNDLLECSVCLERLDTSSKVLPCQHTFCKKCLEDILTTHKELRCPECRVLIDIKIDDLPPNVLLMRILEGMRNAPKKQHQRVLVRGQHTNQTAPVHQHQYVNQVSQITADRIQVSNKGPTQQIVSLHQPHAKALYDYQSKEPDDLSFKKGDLIILRKKIDTHWYFGESNGKQGVFPSIYVDILIPLPPHIPQCKALYDFRMTGEDEEGCLAFNKGAVINVIRRVDENWAEGRLNDRVGIFPLAFVELNGLARSLMKLSTNCQPGPSRVAPPTPTEESPPVILTDHSNSVTTTANAVHPTTTPQIVTSSLQVGSESTSTTTSSSSPSTTPNTSSSNTSSSSSTAPSSPSSPPPRNGPNNVSSPPHRPTPPAPLMLRVSSSQNAEQKEKRHSFSSLNVGHHHHTSHRHSAEILSTDVAEQDRSRRSGDNSTHAPPVPAQNNHGTNATVSHAPAAYVALYPYKPQKPDELELRKGGIYMVTERCQDGWFKGTSNRTQKCGVFPGNYVALARNVTRITSSGIPQQTASPRNGPALEPRNSSGMFQNRTSVTNSSMNSARQPPELPPRSVSPSSATTSTVSCSWHGQPDNTATVPLGRSQSAVMATSSPATIQSTNVGGVQGQMKPAEKNKERKEKGTVSLMRRLTSMKRSKSPPAVGYSMDNPVFEDKTVSSHTHSPSHPVHVRSGSCPSQLLQTLPVNVESKLSGTSSQRLKERLHIMQVTSVPAHTRHGEASSVATTSSPRLNHHRKTNSLDATTKTKPAATTGSSVPVTPGRERFRCIVPYPPNSEYELELKLNDIIYVHKKRDDGWYKGTQQRTGRTGLFPASFVESF